MEQKPENPNQENRTNKKPAKKPYYKKRYNSQPQKKKFWNADKVVSLSAMSIALFTLVVLLYQSHILDKQYEVTVKQQKASVLPYIQLFAISGDDSFAIKITNKGLGPAFIKGLYIKEKDSTFLHYSLYDFYVDNNTDTVYSYNAAGIIDGVVLSPGEEMELFSARGGSSGLEPIRDFFYPYFSKDDQMFFIEYQSVFGDGWIINTAFENTTKEEYGEFEVHYDLVE
jgi:hypothetical protein